MINSVGSLLEKSLLPRIEDRVSYIYIDHAKIIQDGFSVYALKSNEKLLIPLSTIAAIILGPGTSITHMAVKNISDAGCTVIWSGENINHYYASGFGTTDSSKNLIIQAKCYADSKLHLMVVREMYQIRFPNVNMEKFSLNQMRGAEGNRVKDLYGFYSKETGVQWNGRNYKEDDWDKSDDINKMISSGNALLYSICAAIIIAMGFSTGLGFIHNGNQMSFVYDVADLYKADCIIPATFHTKASGETDLKILRENCRKEFYKQNLMKRIPKDLKRMFSKAGIDSNIPSEVCLWDLSEYVAKGKNYGKD